MAVCLAEELVRGLLEAAPDALVLIDANGCIVFANARAEAMFGYTGAELTGLRMEVLIPERFQPPDMAHCAAFRECGCAQRGGEPPAELVGRHRNGVEFPVELRMSMVCTSSGCFLAAALRDASDRRYIERTLREAEERFRLAFEETPVGMALVGLDCRFLRVNRALSQIVGYPPEELTGRTFQSITHSADVGESLENIARLARGEIAQYRTNKRYMRKDGSIVRVALCASVVRDAGGTPLYFVAQMDDVSERLRTEEALRRSEESLNRAQRLAHLGSMDWDLRTNVVTRSAEMLAIYGVDPSPEYEKPYAMWSLIHPDDRERVTHAINSTVRDGGWFSVEYRVVRPEGTERVVLQQGETIHEDGRPVRLVGTCLDVTERKRAEREREESLRWMRAVLEQSPVGLILLHGPRGERVEANSRAQQMLGEPVDSADQYGNLVCRPDGQPVGCKSFASVPALKGERTVDEEFLVCNARGGSTPILASSAPIVAADGSILGAVVAIQDITATKELERLRTEWSSVVAHDLRQPLGTISLDAQMLARMTDEPRLRRHVERIRNAAHRLDRMVGDLMDLSRLEARRLELVRQRVDLAALVRACVDRAAQEATDRPFDVHVQGDVPAVDADPDRVVQVMENLLTNAVKYGTGGTPILVAVSRDEGEISVAVTNLGRGLAKEELSRIFQRFQRASSGKDRFVKGTGLGLYITRSLVEAHGGHVTAECVGQGKVTFRFTLPVASPCA